MKQFNKPLVSVIVPTFNSSNFLVRCLESIRKQSYKNFELIVVDNNSTDSTKEIAQRYTKNVFNRGPERSAQVNFGVTKAKGKYVYKVDSDFVLDPQVIKQCVDKANEGYDAVVVHNSPDATVSWIAKIRKFEVDMYKYDLIHSSARFIKKDVYMKVGGFNELITAGEDYDIQNKLNRQGFMTGFIDDEALHLGEPTNFWKHMKKFYIYGKDFVHYKSQNQIESKKQLGFVRSVYLKHWRKFVRHPINGGIFIIYNFCKYVSGALGFLLAKNDQNLYSSIHKNNIK
jgi:glycosyltransferase involved in cell wall biosynthesis